MNLQKYCLVIVCLLGLVSPSIAQTVSWKIKPNWTEADLLSPDLLRVKDGDKYGLFRTDGTQLVSCIYDRIAEAREGYCVLMNADGGSFNVKGILDVESGNIAYPQGVCHVDVSWPYFSEGLLPVERSGRWGFIAPDGEVKIPFKYALAFPFSHGLAAVRFPDGYFGHIDARQNVSYGTGRLKSNKFIFASTFVQTDKGPMALIVMGNRFYGRNSNGELVPPELPLSGSRKNFTKRIDERDYILEFNDAWQPARIKTGTKTKEYQVFDNPGTVKPNVSSVSGKQVDGGYDLRYLGKAFLAGQFEAALPVTEDYILAKQAGRWGLLMLHPFDKVSIETVLASSTYSHGGTAPVPVKVTLPASLAGSSVHLRCHDLEAHQEGAEKYVLSAPVNLTEVKVDVEVDGIRYLPVLLPMKFTFKRGFSVNSPSEIQLSETQMASIPITIVNTASTPSDYAEVYVDGVLKKTIDPLDPKEKTLINVPLRVSLGDEDEISKNILVEIREENCPPVRNTRTVLFTRHFAN